MGSSCCDPMASVAAGVSGGSACGLPAERPSSALDASAILRQDRTLTSTYLWDMGPTQETSRTGCITPSAVNF